MELQALFMRMCPFIPYSFDARVSASLIVSGFTEYTFPPLCIIIPYNYITFIIHCQFIWNKFYILSKKTRFYVLDIKQRSEYIMVKKWYFCVKMWYYTQQYCDIIFLWKILLISLYKFTKTLVQTADCRFLLLKISLSLW